MAVKKLGEILVEAGLITKAQLNIALEEEKKQKGKRLGVLLVEKGFATEMDIARTLSFQLNIPFIDLHSAEIAPEAVRLVPEKLARQHLIIPVVIEKKNILRVAMADPLNMSGLDDIRFATNFECMPTISTPTEIISAINTHYHMTLPLDDIVGDMAREKYIEIIHEQDPSKDIEELLQKSETPPIIRMVDSIIIHGIENRASDIHIEPHDSGLRLRERVDGLLRDVMRLPKWVQGAVISRIKIMSKMDIAERRVPQDGRIHVRIAGRELDLRISSLPTQYGEKIVMRILDTNSTTLSLDEIGLSLPARAMVKTIIERPQGIVLVTGPTGSGKTSSLYAMIGHIKTPIVNVITLEDPIEYRLEGVSQVAINEKVGLTFAYCLRSVLRQDPDVIFVGEMRDEETAEIAHQASITGHIVFSTLHTIDAISSITRLKNMRIQPYLIASALNGIVAQRLVRKICSACKEAYAATEEDMLMTGIKTAAGSGHKLYRGNGCKECGNTGYLGRIGIFEVLVVNSEVKEMIASDAGEEAIRKSAAAGGMVSMYQDGIEKVRSGITSAEELKRVIFAQEKDVTSRVCPRCSELIKTEFASCPFCGYAIILHCQSCGRQREPDWRYCPYCSLLLKKDGISERFTMERN